MSEEAKQQEGPEDLSKLKGPKWWFGWLSIAALLVVAIITYYMEDVEARSKILATFFGVTAFLGMICALVSGLLWYLANLTGHTVWWWKDGDTWRVTARKYPEQAKGLVIEVRVKARPSFTLRWGAKGWHSKDDGEHSWFVNLRGERILDALVSQAALDSEGLTEKVCGFLRAAGRLWRVIPLDAGRTLRFVDSCGKGVEVFWNGLDGVDLEEILSSVNCANYHRRMQEKARFHDLAKVQAAHMMAALELNAPLDSLTLEDRLVAVIEAVRSKDDVLRCACELLCKLLVALRDDAEKRAGRPKAKMQALQRVYGLLSYLHGNLPQDSSLREVHKISQEEVLRVEKEIEALEVQPASKEASGPGGAATEA